MKKISILFIALLGCKSTKLIEDMNVVAINTQTNALRSEGDATLLQQNLKSVSITDQNTISDILKMINKAHKEPVKFYPEYSLDVCYKDDTVAVLVNGIHCKINGKSYRMSDKLERNLQKNHFLNGK
ncbi:MAG: hypothetical protein IAE95_05255 [Chitinophagaceae bacterium]|nr:hypothetical protein [Chitinophagaceae bacterium]